jgi:hypothetical protein
MDNATFNDIAEHQLDICKQMLVKKGKEYATDQEDRLWNFKQAADLQDTTPMKALGGMMAKHTVSIYDMIREESNCLPAWIEKITDHINYLILLKAIVEENYVDHKEALSKEEAIREEISQELNIKALREKLLNDQHEIKHTPTINL